MITAPHPEALEIFQRTFGDEVVTPAMKANTDNALGMMAKRMLDCIQTVVNVMADEVNTGYTVNFAPTTSASTQHKTKQIFITALPIADAPVGTRLTDIAAILTGFAIHEVGHTKRVGIIDAARTEWPLKVLPKTLANAIEDNVLEARVIERYAGFRDVFVPTQAWVSRATCPTHELEWGGSVGKRVNFVGQVLRYRSETKFASDPRTVNAIEFLDGLRDQITAKMTPAQGLAMVKQILAFIHEDPDEVEPPVDEPEPPVTDGPTGSGLPDDEDENEPPKPKGEGKGEGKGEPTDEDGDGEPTDGGEDDDGEGEGEGNGDGDPDDDTEGGDGEGEGDGDGDGDDGNGADTMNRTRARKGTNDQHGAGGTGQAVSEADPDAGLDESKDKVQQQWDELNNDKRPADHTVQRATDEERVTTRLDAGAFGKIRVVWH